MAKPEPKRAGRPKTCSEPAKPEEPAEPVLTPLELAQAIDRDITALCRDLDRGAWGFTIGRRLNAVRELARQLVEAMERG